MVSCPVGLRLAPAGDLKVVVELRLLRNLRGTAWY